MRSLVLLLTLALLTLAVPATAGPDLGTDPTCVPTSLGGLDYYSEACVDADNSGCRVWHDRSTDQGVERTCYVRV